MLWRILFVCVRILTVVISILTLWCVVHDLLGVGFNWELWSCRFGLGKVHNQLNELEEVEEEEEEWEGEEEEPLPWELPPNVTEPMYRSAPQRGYH